jgi:hypothetical protein
MADGSQSFFARYAEWFLMEGVIGVAVLVVLAFFIEQGVDVESLGQHGTEVEASVIDTRIDNDRMYLTVSYMTPDMRPVQQELRAPPDEFARHRAVTRDEPGQTTVVVDSRDTRQSILKAQMPHETGSYLPWLRWVRVLAIAMVVTGVLGLYGFYLRRGQGSGPVGRKAKLPDAGLDDAVLFDADEGRGRRG